jgi:hypothetical protein
MDSRGVTPVVEKTLTIGIVVLYLAGMTTIVFGGVVPDYRTATGTEVAERTLVGAATVVEDAVPPAGANATARSAVDLPATIREGGYRIRPDGRALVLDHPVDRIDERVRLALPAADVTIVGVWDSGSEPRVRVTRNRSGVRIRLTEAA